jgi:hypothetical protein
VTTLSVDDPPDDVREMLNRVAAALPQLRPDAVPSTVPLGGLKYKTLIPLRSPADDFAAKSMFRAGSGTHLGRTDSTSTRLRMSSRRRNGSNGRFGMNRPEAAG